VLLLGSRPEPLAGWLAGDDIERIVLTGLDEGEVAVLAADVAGASLATEDSRRVHQRTAGNPLFVSETVRAMLGDGLLEMQDGQLRVVSTEAGAPLPVTLRALLGA